MDSGFEFLWYFYIGEVWVSASICLSRTFSLALLLLFVCPLWVCLFGFYFILLLFCKCLLFLFLMKIAFFFCHTLYIKHS